MRNIIFSRKVKKNEVKYCLTHLFRAVFLNDGCHATDHVIVVPIVSHVTYDSSAIPLLQRSPLLFITWKIKKYLNYHSFRYHSDAHGDRALFGLFPLLRSLPYLHTIIQWQISFIIFYYKRILRAHHDTKCKKYMFNNEK